MASKKKKSAKKGSALWRSVALSYPEVEEGSSCNKAAFKVKGKSFLFLGPEDGGYNIMVKLAASRAEAETMDGVEVGPHWITARFKDSARLSSGLVERWIDESYRALAPKRLLKDLD